MATAKLSDIEVQRELGALIGWTRRGEAIAKTWTFQAFTAGIGFVNKVADAAERMQHHPDLDIRYTKISAVLSSHDAGGLTAKDFALAKEMDRLAG